MTRPSREPEYRRKLYAKRDRSPESRSWLVAIRLNWEEIVALDERAARAGVPLATLARNILTGRRKNDRGGVNQHTKRASDGRYVPRRRGKK